LQQFEFRSRFAIYTIVGNLLKIFQILTSYLYEEEDAFDDLIGFLVSHQHWKPYPVMLSGRLDLSAQMLAFTLSKERMIIEREGVLLEVILFRIWYLCLVLQSPS
jgi:hypothetical protein